MFFTARSRWDPWSPYDQARVEAVDPKRLEAAQLEWIGQVCPAPGKVIAAQVTERKGGYLFNAKDNQPKLTDAIEACFGLESITHRRI